VWLFVRARREAQKLIVSQTSTVTEEKGNALVPHGARRSRRFTARGPNAEGFLEGLTTSNVEAD